MAHITLPKCQCAAELKSLAKHTGNISRTRWMKWSQTSSVSHQHISADLTQLLLNLLTVLTSHWLLLFTAFDLLFNARDDPPRWSARTNNVLVRHRQQVALFIRQFLLKRRHLTTHWHRLSTTQNVITFTSTGAVQLFWQLSTGHTTTINGLWYE